MKCEICKDTGIAGYERPMSGANGTMRMVFVPQVCMMCEAGNRAARQYESNLHEGRAGMAGMYPPKS